MDLPCVFKFSSDVEKAYEAEVVDLPITQIGKEVKSISGSHEPGKDNENVERLYLQGKQVNYLPRGLQKFFPNLSMLCLINCDLKAITRKDLVGLENLTVFAVVESEIKYIPTNLFIGMRNLQEVYFKGNKIDFLSSKLLRPIANKLKVADFRNNKNLDDIYEVNKPDRDLKKFLKIIDEKCKTPRCEVDSSFLRQMIQNSAYLWLTGAYADFMIVGGIHPNFRGFKVHKFILGLQSTVLAAKINQKTDSEKAEILKIDNFSSGTVEGFLNFLYTGDIQDESDLRELFVISITYRVPLLTEKTEQLILDTLVPKTALQVYLLGLSYNNNRLKRCGFDVIKGMLPQGHILESAIDDPEKVQALVNSHNNEIQSENSPPKTKN